MRALAFVLTCACGAMVGLCTFESRARADADGAGAATAERGDAAAAADHHRRGVRAFAAHRYTEAIELFRTADALKPSAAIAFNVARAYARLGDDAGALASYREYLRRAPDAQDAGQVTRQIRKFEQRLAERGVQQLTVRSLPAGATVLIDGTPVGVTPYTDELAPGAHTLELRMRGYVSAIRGIDLPPRSAQEIAIELRVEVEPAEPDPPRRAPAPAPALNPLQYAAAGEPEPVPAVRPERPEPRADQSEPRAASSRPRSDDGGASTATVLGWVAVGTGAAALGGALAFELLRSAEENRARNATTPQIEYVERLDTIDTQQTAARVLAGVGGGLSVVGVLLLIAGAQHGEPEEREARAGRSAFTAQLMVSRGAAGARLQGRY